jgi:galactokinase
MSAKQDSIAEHEDAVRPEGYGAFLREVRARRGPHELFAPDKPIFIARSPGRLDLMGGNDDYTGGMVFEATIREGTWAAVQARADAAIVLMNPQMREQGWQERVEFQLADLASPAHVRVLVNREAGLRWTAYVLGLFYWLLHHSTADVGTGASVLIRSDVPLNKGVSSSAAVEVAVLKAAARAYGLDLTGVELAEACQWVENVIAESACGIMDQIAVVLGDEGSVLPLVCQSCLPRPLVRLPGGLVCWGIDSGVRHQVSGVEYEAARAAAFMGYKMICDREGVPVAYDGDAKIPRWTDPRWNGYLANLSPSLYRALEPSLPEQILGSQYEALAGEHVDPFTKVRPEVTYRVQACTRYAVEENHRVQLFVELAEGMRAGHTPDGARLMGELMYQSHLAYSETGLGCAQTDLLVAFARDEGPERGVFGAKITGGGGGGTVAVLARSDAEAALARIVQRYRAETGIEAFVFRGSSMGADRFGVVVERSA